MNFRNTIFAVATFSLAVTVTTHSSRAQATPNVVMIIADDAGYADWGFMNGVNGSNPTPTDIPTPNLDALANRGVKFSRAYVHSNCQPTRAGLVTGGYPYRIGNEVVGNNYYLPSQGFAPDGVPEGVPAATETIWERMKSQGYSTGAIGKWHLGQTEGINRPQHQGVDEFYGIWHGSRTYSVGNAGLPATQLLRATTVDPNGLVNDTVVETDPNNNGEYITNTFGDYAVQFINEHHDDADPFFLYQSFTAPHTPVGNSPDINDPSIAGLTGQRKQYASMMLTMDKEIGRIIDRLEDPDGDGNTSDSITDDTMIVFINDNGGADALSSSPNGADNGVLRRGKGTPWEGGIRVPMIIAGAGVNQAVEGTTYNKPVHGIDILPTVFNAGGGTFGPGDTGIDGVDLLPFINGTDTNNPHETVLYRQRSQFALIKDDWKLVWSGGSPSPNHHLYNLGTDISETNNVAGANPALVAELQRDLTDHEVEFDKQRYEILGQTSETTINIFDHFTLNPTDPGGGVTDIIEGSTGNGDFEDSEDPGNPATVTGAIDFANTANWFHANNTGPNEGINFTNDSQTNGSSQGGSRAGMPFQNRFQINDSGFTVTAAGETFDLSYDFGAGGNDLNWDGDEFLRAFLFTSTTGVDGDTVVGDMTEVAVDIYNVPDPTSNPQWTTHSSTAFYTTTAGDIGKTFYFGMEFKDPAVTSLLFPRIDVIDLSVTSPGGGGASVSDWSDNNAWFEGGTSNSETLLNADAFAGAILEFPTTETFSYVSNNDMIRNTGLEFMLNKIILSGNFTGGSDQNATIQGNDLLFTDDLSGVGPQIAVDATNGGGNGFSYDIDLNLVMYDDLTLTGNGDVTVTINGVVSSYFDPSGLIKDGTSTVVLTAANTYAGDTSVLDGTLSLQNDFLADLADVLLTTGGILDLDFIGTDTIDSLFIDGNSQAVGTWGGIGSGADNETSLITGSGLLMVSTLAGLAGDFDNSGRVDGLDFLLWQQNPSVGSLSDWEANYGMTAPIAANASAVPEPSSAVLLLAGLGLAISRRRR